MKDPLQYTEQELNNLTDQELTELLSAAGYLESRYNTEQMGLKILINSLFGAFANKWFHLFNEKLAQAITGNGRYFIRKLADRIEEALQKMHKSNKKYILYGDTDSCVGSTEIETEQGKINIEDLYDELSGDVEVRGLNNYVKHVKTPITCASVNTNKRVEYKDIKYVMKHKVKKRMFKISSENDSVVITEDHSIMVLRDGELIEVKPREIRNTDSVVKLTKTTNNFTVEDLGIQEEWVYDIEVEDNHNFFGNNTLLHNSVYYSIEPFMKMFQEKKPNLTQGEYVDWADMFEKKIIQPVVDKCILEMSEELNAYNSNIIGAEREVISDVGVLAGKKKYYIRVLDSEGVRYTDDDPYIKIMGLEAIKSSTPEWSKTYLKEAIPRILDKSESQLVDWIRDLKNDFTKTNLNKIATVGGVSRLDYKDTDKGIPIGSRASIAHNKYIKKVELEDLYNEIQPGDKCKRIFLTSPNPFNSNIVAFNSERFVEELQKHNCVDYDTQFQKGFLNPLKLMTNSLEYNLERETESFDDW